MARSSACLNLASNRSQDDVTTGSAPEWAAAPLVGSELARLSGPVVAPLPASELARSPVLEVAPELDPPGTSTAKAVAVSGYRYG